MIPKDGDLILQEQSPEAPFEVWPRAAQDSKGFPDAEGFDCEDPSICE